MCMYIYIYTYVVRYYTVTTPKDDILDHKLVVVKVSRFYPPQSHLAGFVDEALELGALILRRCPVSLDLRTDHSRSKAPSCSDPTPSLTAVP